MAAPSVIVEIGFDLSSQGGAFLLFGSGTATNTPEAIAANPQSIFQATSSKGYPYAFGGTLFYDLTSRVKAVTINRGRSRELDKYPTGVANITFHNEDRALDPYYTDGPFYPNIKPRRDVKISTLVIGGSTAVQFTGIVEDWSLDYQPSGESIAGAVVADGFVTFGGQQLTAHTATSELSGKRLNTVLSRSEVDWPVAKRNIDAGAATLQGDIVDAGTETLNYLQLIEASEPGQLFMSKANNVTFKNRNAGAAIGTVTFSDVPGTAIPYTDIAVSYGTEMLYNRVSVACLGGAPQVATNLSSQNEYGISSLDWNGLIIDTTASAGLLATYLVNKYAQPDLRFEAFGVNLAGLGTAQQTIVLGIEIADIVVLEFRPNNVGTRISKNVYITGIRHDIRPLQHGVTFTVASTDTAAFVFAGGSVSSGTAVVAAYPFSIFDSSKLGL